VFEEQGEMLFTHFGVSGPLVLSASAHMEQEGTYTLHIDMKPALDMEQLDKRLQREIAAQPNKQLPSLMRNGNNCLLLEAMYIGYELTGDRKYLDFGRKTFWNAIHDNSDSSRNKRVVEDAVLVGSGPTKSFAQSFLPLTQFYNAMIGEN
jgi:predicted flavoprotein YhiN